MNSPQPMSAPIIVPQQINPNQMSTEMINMNTGEFIPNMQVQQPINAPIIVPQPMNSDVIATNILNMNQMQTKNNPFFDPSMNTFEFDFTNSQDDLSSDYFGKIEIDLKLEELQRIFNSDLISAEEYIIKKRDLIKKALDKL